MYNSCIKKAHYFFTQKKYKDALEEYRKASLFFDCKIFKYNINLCLKYILKKDYLNFSIIYNDISYVIKNINIIYNFNDVIKKYIQYSSGKKYCIYTAIFGDYDNIYEPSYIDKNIDYFCFTNSNLSSKVFKIIKVDPLFNNNTLSARCLKALSHIFLKNYDITIWIDGCTLIRGNSLEKNLEQLLCNNNIAFHKHFQRNCVYEEIDECIRQHKDSYEKLIHLKQFLKKNKYPHSNGLAETAQILRRQDFTIEKFNIEWWYFITYYTFRDQTSINFILDKFKINYSLLNGTQWSDPYFKRYTHSRLKLINYEPTVDIIILVHNAYKITKKCIDSILFNTHYNNYKIIIVDNHSDIETKRLIQKYKLKYNNIHILTNNENLSFSKANNLAFKNSNSEFVLFLNNDIEIIDSNWLHGLISIMNKDVKIGAIGPMLLYPNYSIQSAGINIEIENNTIKVPATEYKNYRHSQIVDAITGACLLSKREILNKVNCFDEIFIFGQEDIDLCLKIKELNYNIYFTSEYEVIHHESYTRKFNENTLNNREKIKKKWKNRILNLNFSYKKINKKENINCFSSNSTNNIFTTNNNYLLLNQAYREFHDKNFDKAIDIYTKAKEKMPELKNIIDFNINIIKKNNLNNLIDIIIPVYNALDDIKNCLKSIVEHIDSFNINIIIINDCSNQDTSNFLRNFSNNYSFCTLITNKTNLGYTKSINIGLIKSKSKYVICLNSDTIVTKNWIAGLLKCMNSDKRIGIVGPLSNAATWQNIPYLKDSNNEFAINLIPNNLSISEMANLVHKNSRYIYPELPIVNGFCFMIKRSVIDKIGYMDEKNFPIGYGEEVDFCIRSYIAGFKSVIADDTFVFHAKSKSFGHERRKDLSEKAQKILRKKHGQIYTQLSLICRNTYKFDTIRENIQKAMIAYYKINITN